MLLVKRNMQLSLEIKLRKTLLPHENIKINICTFTLSFLTQNNGKLNCWRLLRMHTDPLSRAISFDDHLHCCSPLPTSSLADAWTILTWAYRETVTATLEDLTIFSCLCDVSTYREFYVLVAMQHEKQMALLLSCFFYKYLY